MQFKPFITSAIACAVAILLCAPLHGGIVLIFLVPIVAAWMVYSAFVIWKRPNRRRAQFAKIGMWLLTISGILLIHLLSFVEE